MYETELQQNGQQIPCKTTIVRGLFIDRRRRRHHYRHWMIWSYPNIQSITYQSNLQEQFKVTHVRERERKVAVRRGLKK